MADCTLPLQLHTVQRSVVFLTQQHLSMLDDLHLELFSLQRRRSELTTELNAKRQERTALDLPEEKDLLEFHCRDMEHCLHQQDSYTLELRTQLTQKAALVGALRAELKEKERHFLEELKRRSHCSSLLSTEVQTQTQAAARLSLLSTEVQTQAAARLSLLSTEVQTQTQAAARLSLQLQQRQRGAPGCPSSSLPLAWSRAGGGRVPMERVWGPEEATAMPDPALFLHPRRHRLRRAAAPSPPGPETDTQGGGEGPAESKGKASSSAAAPPAAQTEAD